MKNEAEEVIDGKVDELSSTQNLDNLLDLQVLQIAGTISKGEIHKIIEITQKEKTEREKIPEHYRLLDNKSDRIYRLSIFLTIVIFLVFAIIFLIHYGKDEILKTLVFSLISFLGGLGLGKSSILGTKKDNKDKD